MVPYKPVAEFKEFEPDWIWLKTRLNDVMDEVTAY